MSQAYQAGGTVRTRAIANRKNGHRIGICVPVLGELWSGVEGSSSRARNLTLLRQSLSTLIIWPYSVEAAEEYGRIFTEMRRMGRVIQQIDMQIGAVRFPIVSLFRKTPTCRRFQARRSRTGRLELALAMTPQPSRQELLKALAELGTLFPDWRLGQTLANLALAAGHAEPGGVWDLDDDEALAAARRLIERNAVRAKLAPSEALLRIGQAAQAAGADRDRQWKLFSRRYLAEMKTPQNARLLDTFAALSHHADFAMGCYCADESHCHRSLLRKLLADRGAKLA